MAMAYENESFYDSAGLLLLRYRCNVTALLLDGFLPQVTEPTEEMPSTFYVAVTIIYTVILIAGIIGNGLVIIVICKNKRMRNSTNYYLASLSTADLLIVSFNLPIATYDLFADEIWGLGMTLCKAGPLLQYLTVNSSVLTMLAIGAERFFAICQPLKAQIVCTKGHAMLVIFMVWASSIVISSPGVILVVFFTTYEETCHSKVLTPVFVCSTQMIGHESYFYGLLIGLYIIPGLVLCAIYIVVVRGLMASCANNSLNSRDSRKFGSSHDKVRRQILLMCITVVVFYFIFMFPYNLFVFLLLTTPMAIYRLGFVGYQTFLSISRIMFFLNSCVNPLLYSAVSTKFRRAFLKTLRCWKSSRPEFETSSYNSTTSSQSDHRVKSVMNKPHLVEPKTTYMSVAQDSDGVAL